MKNKEFALLPIYKPVGYSSAEIGNWLKKIFQIKKLGHTGTLDPFAEGLLLFLLGKATRLAEYYISLPKEYIAVGLLGIETDTEDITGKILKKYPTEEISEKDLQKALKKFIGEIYQIPPKYSAKKINGKRAYKLAREGKNFTLQPVKVKIYEIELLKYEKPLFILRVKTSGGTYIRSLIRDIGKALNCGATTYTLVRTAIGNIKIDNAFKPPLKEKEIEISPEIKKELSQFHLNLTLIKNALNSYIPLNDLASAEKDILNYLLPPDYGLEHFPTITINSPQIIDKIKRGQKIPLKQLSLSDQLVRIKDEKKLIAIGKSINGKYLKPIIVFL